jgi:hypothetical protein
MSRMVPAAGTACSDRASRPGPFREATVCCALPSLPKEPALRIDHVILATSDLDGTAARIAADHGWPATGGGRHAGLGTHNRIVPLGGGYLELLGVADPEEAAGSAVGRAVAAKIGEGGGLLGWAVAVDDVEGVAARLGTELLTVTRAGFSARNSGIVEALADSSLPFFLERDPGIPDPGAEGTAGGIAWVEVGVEATRLSEWLGGARLPVRVVGGRAGLHAFGVGEGERRFSFEAGRLQVK